MSTELVMQILNKNISEVKRILIKQKKNIPLLKELRKNEEMGKNRTKKARIGVIKKIDDILRSIPNHASTHDISKEDRAVLNDIHSRIREKIKKNIDFNSIKTFNGNTQASERGYILYVRNAIESEHGTITEKTGSQQYCDFKGVTYPGVDYKINYEVKKVDKSTHWSLNDTIPHDNVYYILIRNQSKTVSIIRGKELTEAGVEESHIDDYTESGEKLLKQVNHLVSLGPSAKVSDFVETFKSFINMMSMAVKSKILSLSDYGQLFKFSTNFGLFTSRPRPNWKMSVGVLDVEN